MASTGKKPKTPKEETQMVVREPPAKKSKMVYICGFCGRSSDKKGVTFSFIDDPQHAVCYRCGWVALALRPCPDIEKNQHLVFLVMVYTNEKGFGIKDEIFAAQFDGAVKVYDGMVSGGTVPSFSPSCEISNTTQYGFSVFQDFGALTAQEFFALFGKKPQDSMNDSKVKNIAFAIPWKGPGSGSGDSQMFGISLGSIPSHIALGMRKVRIHYGSAASRQDLYLSESSQLHANQGDAVFAYVSGLNLKLRGHSLNPANEPPPTYKDIVEANQQAEAQKSAKAASAAANQPAEGGRGSDSEDIPVVKAVGYQGGQLQSKQPKKNKTLKGKGGGAAASADGTVKSSSKQGKGPKDPIADQLKNLDEDMKKVGEKHLATPKGSGVKSLELLISENFLYNDPKLSRGNSAALTGAKTIEKNLRANKMTSTADLLETRIEECEHAGQLTKESFQLMKIDDLETHLDMTKRLWPKFGFHLQIKISFRYVQEHLQVAEDLRIKTDKQALKMYAVFAESLDLLGVGPHGDDVAVFSKDASKVCHVLHRLREEERRVCSDATGSATEENLEEALSAMLQGDGELPLSEEQSELFSAAEAFGALYADVWNLDAMMSLLKSESSGHEMVNIICKRLSKVITKAETVLTEMAASRVLAPIAGGVRRAHVICKGFAQLLNVELDGVETSFKDVTYLTRYSGKHLPERMVMKLLNRADSNWQELVNELIRVSGQAGLMAPERKDLESLLCTPAPLSLPDLERIIGLFHQLQGSFRKAELHKYAERVIALLKLQAQDLLSKQTLEQGSAMVDQLLVGLNRFTTAPGVLSLISDIQAWMTKHSAKLAMADLVAVVTKVNANVEEPLDFEHVKQLVQKCGAALPASESHGLRYGFPTFLVVMWGQIVEKACDPKLESMTEVKAMLNTARECASLAFKDGDPNNIVDLMGKWSESILTGILLQAALKKLDGLGKNPAARLSKDKNLVLLSSIKAMLSKLQQIQTEAGMAIAWEDAWTEVQQTNLDALAKIDLVSCLIDRDILKGVFEPCLTFKAQEFTKHGEQLCGELAKLCGPYLEKQWHADMKADDLKAALEHFDQTLATLDGEGLRSTWLKFEEAMEKWTNFCSKFEDYQTADGKALPCFEEATFSVVLWKEGAPKQARVILLESLIVVALREIVIEKSDDAATLKGGLGRYVEVIKCNDFNFGPGDFNQMIYKLACENAAAHDAAAAE